MGWGKRVASSYERDRAKESDEVYLARKRAAIDELVYGSKAEAAKMRDEQYMANRMAPWFGQYASYFNRYTEVIIGRSGFFNFNTEGYGPYYTIPADDWESRKRKYFLERDMSMQNGVNFRSMLKQSDGTYNRNFDIDFKVHMGGDSGEDSEKDTETAEIKIYNVGLYINTFFKESPILIRSGYVNVYDTIFNGIIKSTEVARTDTGNVLRIEATSDFRPFMGRYQVSKHYYPGTPYMTIIEDLLAMLPIPIGYVHPTLELAEDGFSMDCTTGTIKQGFERVSKAIDYVYSIRGGKFYFVPKHLDGGYIGIPYPSFRIGAKSGLLKRELVQRDEDKIDHKITALLVPFYGVKSIIFVGKAEEYAFSVKELEYISSEDAHYAVMTCDFISYGEDEDNVIGTLYGG